MKANISKKSNHNQRFLIKWAVFLFVVSVTISHSRSQTFKWGNNQKNFIVANVNTEQLKEGKLHINIPKNIFPVAPAGTSVKWKYSVFVQPLEPSNGVYVSNVTEEGFDVIENNNGKSNAKFQWMLVVYDE